MKLFLHPGHAKCGSTSIQRAAIRNRAILARHHVVIPDSQLRLPGESGFNPHAETPRKFFRQVMESGDTDRLAARLHAWQDAPQWRDATFLISAENLVNHLMQPIGRQIHGLLTESFESAEVIYYVRRQDDYVLSAWQQWGFKEGKKFEEYYKEAQRRRNPHYWAIAQMFSQLYGRDSVTVRPLTSAALKDGDLLTDFFGRLADDLSDFDFDQSRSNISLNPFFCEILAEQRGLFKNVHDDELKQRLLQTLGPESELFRKEKAFMSPEAVRSIMDHYLEENRQLHRQFFPHLDFDTVFGPRRDDDLADADRRRLSRQREEIVQKRAIRELIGLLQSEKREPHMTA